MGEAAAAQANQDAFIEKLKSSRIITYVVSAGAFLFSLGTTTVGYYRTWMEDIHESRTELRELIGQLNDLPKQKMQFWVDSGGDKETYAEMAEHLRGEQKLISMQAWETMQRIPEYVYSPEYLLVYKSMKFNGLQELARGALDGAVRVATDANDIMFAYMERGEFRFEQNDIDGGRADYEEGIERMAPFYPTNPDARIHGIVQMRMSWARSEHDAGHAAERDAQLALCDQLVAQMTGAARRKYVAGQVAKLKSAYAAE